MTRLDDLVARLNADERGSLVAKLLGGAEGLALDRLRLAACTLAEILDAGDRDPTWSESNELESAALAYGRALLGSRHAP